MSLPIYLIRMLDHLARVASTNVQVPWNASDVIEQQLELLASTLDLDAMEARIEGFREALRYPYYTPRANGPWLRCRYCDALTEEARGAMRGVCRECHAASRTRSTSVRARLASNETRKQETVMMKRTSQLEERFKRGCDLAPLVAARITPSYIGR